MHTFVGMQSLYTEVHFLRFGRHIRSRRCFSQLVIEKTKVPAYNIRSQIGVVLQFCDGNIQLFDFSENSAREYVRAVALVSK